MRPPRYAVIPTNGRECLQECVEAIGPQVDKVIIICNTMMMGGAYFDKIFYYPVKSGDINISRWWNNGLDIVVRHVNQKIIGGPGIGHVLPTPNKWDVAVLNDDVIVPEGWFDAVAGKMREFKAAAACSGGSGMPVFHTHSGPVSLHTRMQGFAFILAGESGLRADEQFEWWAGDDDLGWRAAGSGGMVMIPGFHVQHLFPNGQVTPAMQATMAADMQRFVDKWGQRPW